VGASGGGRAGSSQAAPLGPAQQAFFALAEAQLATVKELRRLKRKGRESESDTDSEEGGRLSRKFTGVKKIHMQCFEKSDKVIREYYKGCREEVAGEVGASAIEVFHFKQFTRDPRGLRQRIGVVPGSLLHLDDFERGHSARETSGGDRVSDATPPSRFAGGVGQRSLAQRVAVGALPGPLAKREFGGTYQQMADVAAFHKGVSDLRVAPAGQTPLSKAERAKAERRQQGAEEEAAAAADGGGGGGDHPAAKWKPRPKR